MIAALLASATGKSVAIDLAKDFHAPAFHQVGHQLSFQDYRKINALEFSREIIKEANLTPMFYELQANYREAKYVFVVRDPRTNIRSILQRLQLPGRPAEAPPALIESLSPAWKLILDSHWLGVTGDDYIARLASRWQYFCDIASANESQVEIIRYEDFTQNKADSIRELAIRLSLDPRFSIEEETEVQYQGRGDHSIALDDFFGSAALDCISANCRRGMDYFNYDGEVG